jgi:hypothetical protein
MTIAAIPWGIGCPVICKQISRIRGMRWLRYPARTMPSRQSLESLSDAIGPRLRRSRASGGDGFVHISNAAIYAALLEVVGIKFAVAEVRNDPVYPASTP